MFTRTAQGSCFKFPRVRCYKCCDCGTYRQASPFQDSHTKNEKTGPKLGNMCLSIHKEHKPTFSKASRENTRNSSQPKCFWFGKFVGSQVWPLFLLVQLWLIPYPRCPEGSRRPAGVIRYLSCMKGELLERLASNWGGEGCTSLHKLTQIGNYKCSILGLQKWLRR